MVTFAHIGDLRAKRRVGRVGDSLRWRLRRPSTSRSSARPVLRAGSSPARWPASLGGAACGSLLRAAMLGAWAASPTSSSRAEMRRPALASSLRTSLGRRAWRPWQRRRASLSAPWARSATTAPRSCGVRVGNAAEVRRHPASTACCLTPACCLLVCLRVSAACVKSGAHLVDISGEPEYMEATERDAHDDGAVAWSPRAAPAPAWTRRPPPTLAKPTPPSVRHPVRFRLQP